MRINHNIQALNAYRNLYQNQAATAKNLEKLSSGLRINRAADDAAGLAISEKMRSQIRGLNQAETNSLDGVSLMQVAEGAMTEVHAMLQRMRELTVQAANDTNTTSDREAIQLEVDELLKEIDSIAEKTEFNTRRLLDGSSAADTQFVDGKHAIANLVDVPVVKDAQMESGRYAITTSNFDIVNKLTQPGAGIGTDDVLVFEDTTNLPLGEYTIKVTNFVPADAAATPAVEANATIEVLGPDGFTVGKVAEKVGADGASVTFNSGATEFSIDTTKITGAGTAKIQVEASVTVAVAKYPTGADGKPDTAATATPITFEKTLETRNGVLVHGGIQLEFSSLVADDVSEFDLTNKSLTFQIGANTNQSLNIDVPQLSTVKLGIDGLTVLSHDEANRSLHKIDEAINAISATRAKLGATQNRLEHTINNLQVTAENLTSAESRIRDADMAKEMTEFTKNNILNQSAQAMLAQANQLPQGVLQLLQG